MSYEDTLKHMVGVIMVSHYSLKKSINIFGYRAVKATSSELEKTHSMGTYKPMDATKIMKEQKQQALNSLLFVAENRDGRIKARKCAIGSKQRDFYGYNKADGSSPMVYTKGIILTTAIDGHFGNDVATVNIPNDFFWADNDG